MKVSIIIPIYNAEEYLDRCVQSAATQTYRDLEIILVDDGSTDFSSQKCDEWAKKDRRIKVIHQLNSGPGVARNIGTSLATGDFVAYMDSDDWLELNAIELLVIEQARTGADVVWGKALMHTTDGDIEIGEPHYCCKREWVLNYSRLSTNLVMACWRRIIRRSLLVDHNIHVIEGFNYAEDKVQMTQIAYYAESFSYIDDIIYHYNRLNSDSLTAQNRKNTFNIDVFLQEVGSILWIENFYADKEKVYHDEVIKAKLRLLKNWLEKALEFKSPKGYRTVKKIVKGTNASYYSEIGLDSLKNRLVFYDYYTVRVYRWFGRWIYRLLYYFKR